MPDYRACIIGSDGHFYKTVALDALDDAAAIEAVKQLVDGHDVELWQFDRKIGKFGQEKNSEHLGDSFRGFPFSAEDNVLSEHLLACAMAASRRRISARSR